MLGKFLGISPEEAPSLFLGLGLSLWGGRQEVLPFFAGADQYLTHFCYWQRNNAPCAYLSKSSFTASLDGAAGTSRCASR